MMTPSFYTTSPRKRAKKSNLKRNPQAQNPNFDSKGFKALYHDLNEHIDKLHTIAEKAKNLRS
ncbi:MAG: hypothetical protein R2880_13420 [Deinococcales bacterium]